MSREILQPEPVPPPSLPLPLGEGRGEGAPTRPAFTPSTLPLGEGLPSHLPLPLGEGRGEGALPRPAFTLVELLVVISIILVLMGMIGSAVSSARGSQRVQATQALIAKLDRVVQQHYSSYASRVVTSATSAAGRGTFLRRLASAELPDNWADVKLIVEDARRIGSGTTGLIFGGTTMTGPQWAYAGIYTSSTAAGLTPTDQFADAECLFMIVMMGGVADCLDCDALATSQKGDTDNDGAFEFLDAWGQPIRYVLWPAALELPPGNGRFFSSTPPFSSGTPVAAKGGTMRPLIFSAGPDTKGTIEVSDGGNFGSSAPSENPVGSNVGGFLPPSPPEDQSDRRADNITNFDAEARK